MPLQFSSERELEKKRVTSWKPPAHTCFGSTSAFWRRLYYPQAAPGPWLHKVGLQGPTHSCPTEAPSNGHLCPGISHASGQDFLKAALQSEAISSKCPFLLSLLSRGGQTCSAVWSFPPPSPDPISLYPSETSLSITLLLVQYVLVSFLEDSHWHSLQLGRVGLN